MVIGKRATHVKAADAMNYVFGYTNFIDGSARGVLPPTNVFYQMKSRDTFAPIGPYIVTADEITDPHKLQIKLCEQRHGDAELQHRRHGAQDSALHRMGDARSTRWSPATSWPPAPTIAASIRSWTATRSSWTCEGCGTLHIKVRDDLKRTWARITRLQHKQSGAEGVHTKQTGGKYAK